MSDLAPDYSFTLAARATLDRYDATFRRLADHDERERRCSHDWDVLVQGDTACRVCRECGRCEEAEWKATT